MIFAGNNVLALVPPWTCAPQLMPKKNKLRMASMRNALESGVERTKREKVCFEISNID